MFQNLENTNRCELIQETAISFWNDIIDLHRSGQDSSEIYYTKKLVSKIINSSKKLNFSIWATEPGLEKKWGSDIDIYIERNTNNFKLYAFQAKLLKLGNEYSDINRFSNGNYQWDKLDKLKAYKDIKKCYINYLFYNGVDDYSHNGLNCCNEKYNQEQFGLSYVRVEDVERIGLSKNSWFFDDFHSSFSKPLSELVCCYQKDDDNEIMSYDYDNILSTLNQYQQISFEQDLVDFIQRVESNNLETESNNERKIERNPDIIIVVRNTESTY
jgi:hypothetical protein